MRSGNELDYLYLFHCFIKSCYQQTLPVTPALHLRQRRPAALEVKVVRSIHVCTNVFVNCRQNSKAIVKMWLVTLLPVFKRDKPSYCEDALVSPIKIKWIMHEFPMRRHWHQQWKKHVDISVLTAQALCLWSLLVRIRRVNLDQYAAKWNDTDL